VGVSLVTPDLKERPLAGGYDLATGAIQATPAVHVYRAEHGAWDGVKGVVEPHLALHDMILTDTRIPPAGFKASATTTPTGDVDFSDGNGGYRSSDEVTLDLAWPADAAGEVTISARLYYQSMTPEHVEFLKAANTTNQRGKELATIFEATGRGAPLVIARAETTLGKAMTTGAGGAGGSAQSSGTAATSGASGSGGDASSGGSEGGCGCSDAGAPVSAAGAMMTMMALAMAGGRRARRRRDAAPSALGATTKAPGRTAS
jgi:hypothetical protein